MNGLRLTTGIGIAVGGVGGALVALLGAPKAPAPRPPPVAVAAASASTSASPAAAATPLARASATGSAAIAQPVASAAVSAEPSAARAPASVPAATLTVGSAPTLEPATTREALLKAEMLCDQKKDFDECERAAASLEKGAAGSADPEQAKRFRKIALTHLVTQCEAGSPHACFVMAGKYRAGVELPAKPTSADALEKRGLELCRMRSAPECPSP